MSDLNISALIAALRDPEFCGPRQHLRPWGQLDVLHAHAITALETLWAEREKYDKLNSLAAELDDELRALRPEIAALRAKFAAADEVVEAAREAVSSVVGFDSLNVEPPTLGPRLAELCAALYAYDATKEKPDV